MFFCRHERYEYRQGLAGVRRGYLTPVFLTLAFIGLTDVEFVYAEGLAMPEKREAALAEATQTIQHLAA